MSLAHEFCPLQLIVHDCAEHWTMPWHELVPLQLTLQLDVPEHATPPLHALLPQVMEHGCPGGQVTLLRQLPVPEQSKWQLPASHAPPPAAHAS
jgi:hypothetical protein